MIKFICYPKCTTSVTGRPAFEMTENSIKLYDFQDNYYEIDYNGKEV